MLLMDENTYYSQMTQAFPFNRMIFSSCILPNSLERALLLTFKNSASAVCEKGIVLTLLLSGCKL